MSEEKQVEFNSAKEIASKFIGKWGLGVVVILVLAAIWSASKLEAGTLAVVHVHDLHGSPWQLSVSSWVLPVRRDKEEKPEITIIRGLD